MREYCEVQTSLPQDIGLGPLLFILYFYHFLLSMPIYTIITFADDTPVISTNKNCQVVKAKRTVLLKQIHK